MCKLSPREAVFWHRFTALLKSGKAIFFLSPNTQREKKLLPSSANRLKIHDLSFVFLISGLLGCLDKDFVWI